MYLIRLLVLLVRPLIKPVAPPKSTRSQKKNTFFVLILLIQELEESDSDSEVEGVTEPVDPSAEVKADQGDQP